MKSLDSKLRATILLIIFSILFYFPTILSLSVFAINPNIRAIGRFSIIITFLCLCFLTQAVSKIKFSKKYASVVTIFIFIIGISDAYAFKLARPSSKQTSTSANEIKNNRLITLANLESKFPNDCPVNVIPMQPFPEFDNPTDSNIDYASYDLILAGNTDLKWGVGTFKNTYENKFFENLYSQLPNFIRADLPFQLNYANAMGFCGGILDRTLMIPSEAISFQELLGSQSKFKSNCISDLGGEKYEGQSRFYSYDFLKSECRLPYFEHALKFFQLNKSNKLFWKNNTAYGNIYKNGLQFFFNKSEINLTFVPIINLNKVDFQIFFNKRFNHAKICYSSNKSKETCSSLKKYSEKEFKLSLKETFIKGKIYRFNFRLDATNKETGLWSIYPKAL